MSVMDVRLSVSHVAFNLARLRIGDRHNPPEEEPLAGKASLRRTFRSRDGVS